MEILSMLYLGIARKWVAQIKTVSSGRVILVDAEKPTGLQWRITCLDGIDVPPEFSIIQEDTPAFEALEKARRASAASDIPGVTPEERDMLIG